MNSDLTTCVRCPRLVSWTQEVAQVKRKQFMDQTYWGKPVPSFGPMDARVLIVGLAPAAHGANRTGRMFTGDESGRWLYRSLHRAGFASQPESHARDDELRLYDARISAVVHCAPPDNRPTPLERDTCLPYLVEEMASMPRLTIILALGKFAWDGVLSAGAKLYPVSKPKPVFTHGAKANLGPWMLMGSYHPSQQNTFTRRLTEPMFDRIFSAIRDHLD